MGLSLDLGSPVNTALLIYILYTVQRIILPPLSKPTKIPHEFKYGYSWMPKSHPPTVLYTTFTPKTLQPFNGKDGGRILLAINGIVFDVTSGRNFYGPSSSFRGWNRIRHSPGYYVCLDGMYGNFSGRDASRGMAKQSFDEGTMSVVTCCHSLSDLSL